MEQAKNHGGAGQLFLGVRDTIIKDGGRILGTLPRSLTDQVWIIFFKPIFVWPYFFKTGEMPNIGRECVLASLLPKLGLCWHGLDLGQH